MKKLLLSLIILSMVGFSSCEEEEEIEFVTLTAIVKNASGTLQSGVDVEVFDQLTFDTESEKVTGSNGKAEFKLTESKLYSVLATKGNLAGSFKITNVLMKGEAYEVNLVIK